MQNYSRPQTSAEAARLVTKGRWRVLAGGTDLYPGAGTRLDGAVLDITDLPEFSRIEPCAVQGKVQGLRIGAAVSWSAIAEANLPPALRALQQAARQIGGRQVQNTGTIGGNLCNASPAADGVPPLLAVEAEVELLSAAGRRRLGMAQFLLGPRRTALRPDEILASVILPNTGLGGRSAFVKLGARSHLVISIAMVAVRLAVEENQVTGAAVAVGSCSPVAVRLPAVEAALLGARVGDVQNRLRAGDIEAALTPIDDVRASAAYRREAAVELVRRAVAEALQ